MTKISNQYSLTNILTADLANSRLGINNVSPAYSLDAYSTSASAARISITGTTNFVTSQFVNTSGTMYVGIDDSAGANFTGTAYGRFIYSSGAYPFIFNINGGERMRITSAGNVGIGYSAPTNKLEVNGSGYFSGSLSSSSNVSGNNVSASGTTSGATLVVNNAIYTYNVTTYYYGNCFTFTPPNMLNSSVDNSNMRMYMVWVWGVNGATEAGARVWMVAVNGPGTAYTANEILGRDANGGTGLSISRSSATQLQICSNNNAFIKFVSVMALMSN
jgi:hypothetical protein